MKSRTWTGLSFNKKTGEEYKFFIWKDGKKMEFDIDEARTMFPRAVMKHEQSATRILMLSGE